MSVKVIVPKANKSGVWVNASIELPPLFEYCRCIVNEYGEKTNTSCVERVCELITFGTGNYTLLPKFVEIETKKEYYAEEIMLWWKQLEDEECEVK